MAIMKKAAREGGYGGLLKLLRDNENDIERQQEAFAWNLNTWQCTFRSNPVVLDSLSYLDETSVDRATLYQLVARLKSTDHYAAIKVFIWSQVWGYGRVGYGAWRACQILNQRQAGNSLAEAFKLIRRQGTVDAYSAMSRGGPQNIPGLGSAFATKYLHFAGYYHVPFAPQPLVLDALVGRALREGEPQLFGTHCGEDWCEEDYTRYIRAVHALTTAGPFTRVEPQAIELALFRIGDRLRHSSRIGPNNNQA